MIVGGGLAGGNAAATLREEGFGAESCSSAASRASRSAVLRCPRRTCGPRRISTAGMSDLPIGIRSTTSRGSSSRAWSPWMPPRTAWSWTRAEELEYQKVLIATGGRNRRLDVPGAQLPGIHYLRTVAECDAIKREAVANRHAVVVGMGFIGCEVAASLTQLGVRVTAVFPGERAPGTGSGRGGRRGDRRDSPRERRRAAAPKVRLLRLRGPTGWRRS